ncbi:MAG: hypothetical protein VB035_00165 [Candidatus Fimivivens sp.]|nr:hypothetical protein [Candidatus Fimivivens sp.]
MQKYIKAMRLLMVATLSLLLCLPVYAATPAEWTTVKGTYAREESIQSGTLSLMYLDNDVVMFEFFISESTSDYLKNKNFCLAGAFYLDDNGVGIYENPKTGNVQLRFELSGNTVTIKQSGVLPMNVGGKYRFVNSGIKVTDAAATEILEQLPTAATSLNHNNGEYKLSMSQEMVDGWFYDVKANFVDTNALIAEFYIAGDMSAVYRVDTETPILIWGSAQPMLDAVYPINAESLLGTTSATGDERSSESADQVLKAYYVSALPQSEAIAVGNSTPIIVTVPGEIGHTMQCFSSSPKVVKVDDKGVITAVSAGETAINVTVTIDDAKKSFTFTVRTFDK